MLFRIEIVTMPFPFGDEPVAPPINRQNQGEADAQRGKDKEELFASMRETTLPGLEPPLASFQTRMYNVGTLSRGYG